MTVTIKSLPPYEASEFGCHSEAKPKNPFERQILRDAQDDSLEP